MVLKDSIAWLSTVLTVVTGHRAVSQVSQAANERIRTKRDTMVHMYVSMPCAPLGAATSQLKRSHMPESGASLSGEFARSNAVTLTVTPDADADM
jgi:hypothetical protein